MERKMTDIDKDLEDIFDEYLAHRRGDITQMEAALSKGDFDAIRVIGHRLAGNAGSYGLIDLGEIGKRIEAEASVGNAQALRELWKDYKTYMEALKVRFV